MPYELTDQEAADLKRLLLKVNLSLLENQQSAERLEFAAMTMLNYAHAIRTNIRRGGNLSTVPPQPQPSDDATASITPETLHAA